MAWNQPGNNGQDRDPWGSSNKGGNSDGNKGGRNRGASDLDDLFRKMSRKLGGLGGGKGGNNNGQSGGNNRPPVQFAGGRISVSLLPPLLLSGPQPASIRLKKRSAAWLRVSVSSVMWFSRV